MPRLQRVELEIEPTDWNNRNENFTFPTSFSKISELQIIVKNVSLVLNVENLYNLSSFVFKERFQKHVFQGLSRLTKLKTVITPYLNTIDLHSLAFSCFCPSSSL
ncbi:hypothetical protein RCL1_007479 [Eukaryota sp. TZLM3-RCL]